MARLAEWMLRELSADGVRIHDHWVYPYIADQDPADLLRGRSRWNHP